MENEPNEDLPNTLDDNIDMSKVENNSMPDNDSKINIFLDKALVEAIFNLVKKAHGLLKSWGENNTKVKLNTLVHLEKTQQNEIELIKILDKREKWFKGILICCSLIALIISANLDLHQSIVPIIAMLIGLLMKSNSISDFFAYKNENYKNRE